MAGEKDFLAQCMDSVDIDSSIDELQQSFCQRCYQKECTHSMWGKPTWYQRMMRQKHALDDPDIVDPNRPDVRPIAQQDFEDARNLNKDAWSMPIEGDGGKRVHKAEPPTKSVPADKVDESAKALGGENDTEETTEEDEGSPPEPPQNFEQDSGDKGQKNNTEVPDEGIMVEDDGNHESRDRKKKQKRQHSGGDWTHPGHKSDSGGLTVNVDDGSKVDPDN